VCLPHNHKCQHDPPIHHAKQSVLFLYNMCYRLYLPSPSPAKNIYALHLSSSFFGSTCWIPISNLYICYCCCCLPLSLFQVLFLVLSVSPSHPSCAPKFRSHHVYPCNTYVETGRSSIAYRTCYQLILRSTWQHLHYWRCQCHPFRTNQSQTRLHL